MQLLYYEVSLLFSGSPAELPTAPWSPVYARQSIMPRSHSSHSARTPHVRIVEPFVALITRRRKSNIRAGNNIASAPTCNALSLFFFLSFRFIYRIYMQHIFSRVFLHGCKSNEMVWMLSCAAMYFADLSIGEIYRNVCGALTQSTSECECPSIII